MITATPELLVNTHDGCGENPLYDEKRGLFYWCDIPDAEFYEWNPKTRTHRLIYKGTEECGAFTLQEDGKFLMLLTGNAGILDPVTGVFTPLAAEITSNTGRFNDCIAKPDGGVISGTADWVTKIRGALFDMDVNLKATKICEGTACSNGLGFTPKLDGVYWSDSTAKTVYYFDYDQQTGLSNRKAWLVTPDFTPDGLTVDLNGNLWIAFYDGGFIRHYSSEGELIQQIDVPSKHVTSCIFGGDNYDELYITSAGGKEGDDSTTGGLFRLKCEVGGKPEFRTKIGLK
jgi:sugar lactone lactonase YvrE